MRCCGAPVRYDGAMVMTLIGVAGIVCYGIATAQLFQDFARGREAKLRRLLPALAAALACHGWLVFAGAITPEGVDRSIYTSLSTMGWIINAVILLGALVRPMSTLGLVTFPIGAAFLSTQLALAGGHEVMTHYGWQLETHIGIALFSFAILSVAAAQALLLALQEKLLRTPAVAGRLAALPPLTVMEQLLFQLIGLGFVLLTITLVTGAIFVDDLFGQALVHKTVLSFTAWLVFGALLWGRWRHGWRGRRAIRLTLLGVFSLALAYFGSKFVIEVVLDRV